MTYIFYIEMALIAVGSFAHFRKNSPDCWAAIWSLVNLVPLYFNTQLIKEEALNKVEDPKKTAEATKKL